MQRLFLAPLAVLVLAACLASPQRGDARPDDEAPYAGTWKVTAMFNTNEMALWLLKFDKEGKSFEVVNGLKHRQTDKQGRVVMDVDVRKTKVSEPKADPKAVRCVLTLPNGAVFGLVAYPGKNKDAMTGSLRANMTEFIRIRLEKTEDTEIDPEKAVKNMAGHNDFQAAVQGMNKDEQIKELKNVLTDHENKPITYLASQILMSLLVSNKADSKEFEGPAKAYVKQAEPFGHEITVGANMEVGMMLTAYEKTQALGLTYTRKAAEMVTEDDPKGLALSAYLAYVMSLEKNKKSAEAKDTVAKLEKTAAATLETAKDDKQKFDLTRLVAGMLLSSPNNDVKDFGIKYATDLEKLVKQDDPPQTKLGVLYLLGEGYKSRGKADDAKKVFARAEAIETDLDRKFEKANVDFDVEKFGKRKGKSQRVVLVELFTGAQCPPCVAADVSFDAGLKTFTPRDAVFLQYHLHIPGPDALTNADTEARSRFYGDDVEGTPTMFIDGKATTPMGGQKPLAEQRYGSMRELIAKAVEEDAAAKLDLSLERKGAKIDVTAKVADLAPKDPKAKNARLRIALVEEVVPYAGRNGQRLHQHVVRAFVAPADVKGGGAAGIELKGQDGTHKVTIDLDVVRKNIEGYLSEFTSKQGQFPTRSRPMELKKLKVVAFIQDETTKAVHQAAQIDVPEDKEAKKD